MITSSSENQFFATILTTLSDSHYFLQQMLLLFVVNITQCSDVYYKNFSGHHYTKIMSIVADISSNLHYI